MFAVLKDIEYLMFFSKMFWLLLALNILLQNMMSHSFSLKG